MRLSRYYLLFNLRENHPSWERGVVNDCYADWDIQGTIDLLAAGLSSIGMPLETISVRHNESIGTFDLDGGVISICEMTGGSFREALIPSVCETLSLPYLFSTPEVLTNTLDKDVCNYLARSRMVNVPEWISVDDSKDHSLECLDNFPYIVKPVHEGSGIGIDDSSVVFSFDELKNRIDSVSIFYKQKVLVQEYIDGLEVTVGVIGSGRSAEVLAPLAMDLGDKLVYGFHEKEGSVGIHSEKEMASGRFRSAIEEQALRAYTALGCRDCARLDFRLSSAGVPYLIEINPLPHLHPELGDFVRSADLAGYSYETLLKKIVERIYQ